MDPSMGWALSFWIAWFLGLFGIELDSDTGSSPEVTKQPGGKERQPKTWKQSESDGPLPDPPIDKRLTKASAILD